MHRFIQTPYRLIRVDRITEVRFDSLWPNALGITTEDSGHLPLIHYRSVEAARLAYSVIVAALAANSGGRYNGGIFHIDHGEDYSFPVEPRKTRKRNPSSS